MSLVVRHKSEPKVGVKWRRHAVGTISALAGQFKSCIVSPRACPTRPTASFHVACFRLAAPHRPSGPSPVNLPAPSLIAPATDVIVPSGPFFCAPAKGLAGRHTTPRTLSRRAGAKSLNGRMVTPMPTSTPAIIHGRVRSCWRRMRLHISVMTKNTARNRLSALRLRAMST
jgi:hypothetical protein